MSQSSKANTRQLAATRILEKWGISSEPGAAILNVSSEAYAHAKRRDLEQKFILGDDQLKRISYVLNIHAVLRAIFNNPVNLYGFMSMANHNEGFDGRTPLEIIGNGDLASLRETWLRVERLTLI